MSTQWSRQFASWREEREEAAKMLAGENVTEAAPYPSQRIVANEDEIMTDYYVIGDVHGKV